MTLAKSDADGLNRKAMSLEERVGIVRVFNTKAERLNQLSFTKFVREKRVGFSVSAHVDKEVSFSSVGPDQESTEAFVLTVRLFLQPNEPLSPSRFVGIFSKLPLKPELISELQRVTALINEFLERPCQIQVGEKPLPNREVLEVFLYGGLAHTSRIQEFEAWQSNPIVFGMLQVVFYGILAELLRYIFWVHDNNKTALSELNEELAPPDAAV